MKHGLIRFCIDQRQSLLLPALILTAFLALDLAKTAFFHTWSHISLIQILWLIIAFYSWLMVCAGLGHYLRANHPISIPNHKHVLMAFVVGNLHLLFVCVVKCWLLSGQSLSKSLILFSELFFTWIPVEMLLFFLSWVYWVRHFDQTDKQAFSIKTTDGWLMCQPEQVRWARSEANYILFNHNQQHYRCRNTLSHFMGQIGTRLIRPHRSAAINPKHIESIDGNRVRMDDGTHLPISRKNQKTLIKQIQAD